MPRLVVAVTTLYDAPSTWGADVARAQAVFRPAGISVEAVPLLLGPDARAVTERLIGGDLELDLATETDNFLGPPDVGPGGRPSGLRAAGEFLVPGAVNVIYVRRFARSTQASVAPNGAVQFGPAGGQTSRYATRPTIGRPSQPYAVCLIDQAAAWRGNTPAGVFEHELGHALGLFDVYGPGERGRLMFWEGSSRTGSRLTSSEIITILASPLLV
jgi:hypothetical protein